MAKKTPISHSNSQYSFPIYSKYFQELAAKAEQEDKRFDPQKHKDETRSKIALLFTRCYFGLIFLALVGVPTYNVLFQSHALDIKDTLLVISSVIGGPFGFVVGYYFKGSEGGK